MGIQRFSSFRWSPVRFGDVVREVRETERDPLANGIERYIGLEHLDPESLHIKRSGWIAEDEPSFTKRFRAGQLLFGRRRAYQRKAAIAEFDGICSGDIIVMEAKEKHLLPDLLPFIVQSEGFYEYALRTSAGSLSPRTKWSHLASYEFALPPKDEQRRIADILWAAENAIEGYLHVQKVVSDTKRVIMQILFSTSETQMITLGEVGNWVSGGTPSRTRKDYWSGDLPWASPKDMKTDVLNSTEETVSITGAEDGSRIVPNDTIFVVVRGMILAHTLPVAMTGRRMAFNQDMKAIIVSDDFNPWFVFYWFQANARRILRITSESSHGTKRIPVDLLQNMSIPYIAKGEQDKVVGTLKQLDAQISSMEHHQDRLVTLKRTLLENFLSMNEGANV